MLYRKGIKNGRSVAKTTSRNVIELRSVLGGMEIGNEVGLRLCEGRDLISIKPSIRRRGENMREQVHYIRGEIYVLLYT